jgi:hypothetical protein
MIQVLTCGERSIEDILSEQQTDQEPDNEDKAEHEEAISQKPTCNNAIEHLNALQRFVEGISEVPQQIWKTHATRRITFDKQKTVINNPCWIISSRN